MILPGLCERDDLEGNLELERFMQDFHPETSDRSGIEHAFIYADTTTRAAFLVDKISLV